MRNYKALIPAKRVYTAYNQFIFCEYVVKLKLNFLTILPNWLLATIFLVEFTFVGLIMISLRNIHSDISFIDKQIEGINEVQKDLDHLVLLGEYRGLCTAAKLTVSESLSHQCQEKEQVLPVNYRESDVPLNYKLHPMLFFERRTSVNQEVLTLI